MWNRAGDHGPVNAYLVEIFCNKTLLLMIFSMSVSFFLIGSSTMNGVVTCLTVWWLYRNG